MGCCLRLVTVKAAATGSNTPKEAAKPLPEPVGHVAKGTAAARSQSGRLSRPCACQGGGSEKQRARRQRAPSQAGFPGPAHARGVRMRSEACMGLMVGHARGRPMRGVVGPGDWVL
eukprot:scaffold38651_cov14-Tisochrysis_lutea.AAC.1